MPVRQLLRLTPGLLPGMTSAQLVTKKKTATKKTVKMLQKYCKHTKMPKGWIHIEEEEEDIKEVWQKQREALSASITLGRCSQLGCSAVSHQFPKASSKTTGITTSPSAC